MRDPKQKHRYDPSNKIHPLAIIYPNVEMGKNNVIGPYAVIGGIGECRGETERKGTVVIGDNNVINSGVTIDSPVRSERTKIGSDCFIMTKSHIGHDCLIGDNVTIAPGAVIGGVCIIDDYVCLGINCSIHQRLHIGESVMVGMGTIVTKHIYPFCTIAGSPCRIIDYNITGVKKRGLNNNYESMDLGLLYRMIDFPAGTQKETKQHPFFKLIEDFKKQHPSEKIINKFR